MNNRIFELANQVLPREDHLIEGDPKVYAYFFSSHELVQFAELILADYAKQLVQANMSNRWYVQAMDEHYEQKWAHRFG
jgi:hypothetical protein